MGRTESTSGRAVRPRTGGAAQPLIVPATSPITQRGAKTRASLVTAARLLFEEQGYLGTNAGDIAVRARCAYGTFYTYFNSKEEIFSEVVRELLADFRKTTAAEPRVAHPDNVAEIIERAMRGYLRAYRANSSMMAVLEQVATFNPRLAEVRRETRRYWVKNTSASIRQWQQDGLVHAELDAGYAATALGSMIDRSAYVWNVLGEPYEFDMAVQQLTILYCNALGVPRGWTD